MKERVLDVVRAVLTNNPITILQNIIRLKPKMLVLINALALLFKVACAKLGVKLPSSINLSINTFAGISAAGIVNEYKRLLPIRAFSDQTYLKKSTVHFSFSDPKHTEVTFKQYDGFPVFTLLVESPKERGRLIAQTFAAEIVEAFDQYYNWLPTAISLLYTGNSLANAYTFAHQDPKSPLYGTDIDSYLQKQYNAMQFWIPYDIVAELEGILEIIVPYIQSLNRESGVTRPVPTLDSIKLLIALPDIVKMSPSAISLVHCTAAVRRLPDGAIQHLRTLDYASLGTLTQFTALYIYRSTYGRMPVASVAFVPFTAALSVTNGYLTATINDAGTTNTKRFKKDAIPETLCLRYALERCKTFTELDRHFNKYPPASTCSFVIASKDDARIYQMLPIGDSHLYTVRRLSNNHAIVVTNHHYLHDDNGLVGSDVNHKSINWHTTFERERIAIDAINAGNDADQVLRAVNVHDTAQSMFFTRREKNSDKTLELKLSVKNHDAADCTAAEYHTLPVGELLEEVRGLPRYRA